MQIRFMLIIQWAYKVVMNINNRLDSLAERSKALASGASPKGRGFKSHSCHFLLLYLYYTPRLI